MERNSHITLEEAKIIQAKMREEVTFLFPYREEDITLVAGIDVSYDQDGFSIGVVVVLAFPSLEILEVAVEKLRPTFPYIPGFLSFREGPVIEKAFSKLCRRPQIVFFDGQGIAHPRGVGLATHMGVALGVVSIGVAKKPLVGSFLPPGEKRGDFSPVEYKGRVVGVVLRTQEAVKPVFVSPGNCIGIVEAKDWTLKVTGKYRVPEPTRLAHILSEREKR